MPKYRVIAPMGVTLRHPIELYGLTEDQVKSREHVLKDLEKGKRYGILTEASFKRGEVIGVIGDVNGALLEMLADPVTGETAGQKKVAKKAAARAGAAKDADKK